MKRVRKCIKPNLVRTKSSQWWWLGGGVGVPKIKVAQNGLKHMLALDILKSDDIFEIEVILEAATSKHPSNHTI